MLFALLTVLHVCASAVLVYGIDRLALIPWRRAGSAHWTERARLLWPARKTNAMLLFAVPASLAAAQASLFASIPLAYLYAAFAGIVGAILGMWPMTRAMFPELRFGAWMRDVAAAFVIRLMLVGVLIVAGVCMPYRLNSAAISVTAAVVAFTLWLIWGGMIWLLRMSGILITAPDRLANVVSAVSARMELSLPRVWLLRGYGANALALPAVHTLIVTEAALRSLSDEELGAVCAHEFAHLNEPRGVILARMAAAFVLLPGIFFKPAVAAWQFAGYFGICMAIVMFSKLATAFRRRMEKAADSVATTHEGPFPGTYARALERLYEINQVPAVLRGGVTHPNLYDRLLASGVTPAYPRPDGPARFTWQYGLVILLLIASGFGAVTRYELEDRKKHAATHARLRGRG